MASLIRRLVSRQKIRFQNEEFDLDLTYITDRIIAMSWPGDGAEGWYRNPIGEVARMLDKYHHGHYRVYNLCAERGYDESRFTGGTVITFPMDDHHVPPLPMLFDFIRDAQQYLEKDTANTAVVHCKAGKGRTGICVAALLLSLGRSHTWSAALAQFAISRTANGVGVTIASQRRWVQYFDIARAMDSLPPHAPLDLSCIRLHGLPPRLAPRLVVVLSLREHSAGKGYHSRVLVAAGLGRGFTADNGRCPAECESHCGCVAGAPASSFGQLLCGAPNKSSSVESKKPQPGRQLALMDGAPIKPALRVQSGQGWKLTLVNESTLTLQFEDEHGHYDPCCRVDGDFRVQVFVDCASRSRSLFWAWHNTAFMSGSTCTLTRDGLDKVSSLVPGSVELSLDWRVAGESLPSALTAARGTSESALLSPVQQRSECNAAGGGDSGFTDPDTHTAAVASSVEDPLGGGACAQIPEGMLRRRTPEPVPTRTSRQPPAMAGAVESPRDSPEDGKQHDSDAIDLSLLKLYDGQWMGAGHVTAQRHDAARRQSLPAADATARVTLHPSWATNHLHRTSAFLKVAEERLNGSGAGRMRSVPVLDSSEPLFARRTASASAGHSSLPLEHSAFAGGGGSSMLAAEDSHPGLPGIRVSAMHSHAEPDDSAAYIPPAHPPPSPLAGALSNPLSVGSGMFARTISQPSFPHASTGGGSAPAVLSPRGGTAGASVGGFSGRSQPHHRGASSFMEYCQTSQTSVADELSDEEDSNCALLPQLDGRGGVGGYSHCAGGSAHGKIPLRLPRPAPRRQPRHKAGMQTMTRGVSGCRAATSWRLGGEAEAGSDSEGWCVGPPMPASRSRKLARCASGRDRAAASYSGLRTGGALTPVGGSRRRRRGAREAAARRSLQAPCGASSDSTWQGRTAPSALTCEDPLAPWAGDPASIVAGLGHGGSMMSMEDYIGSASAFFTSDGTGFSGDLRDSISFGTVR